jgi:hypothetical protein
MQMVQRHPVPDPRLLHLRRQLVARLRKHRAQRAQTGVLLGRSVQWNADQKIHIGCDCTQLLYEVFRFLDMQVMRSPKGICTSDKKTLPFWRRAGFDGFAHKHLPEGRCLYLQV